MLVRKMYLKYFIMFMQDRILEKKVSYFIRIVSNFFIWRSFKVYNLFRASVVRYKPSKLQKNLNQYDHDMTWTGKFARLQEVAKYSLRIVGRESSDGISCFKGYYFIIFWGNRMKSISGGGGLGLLKIKHA